MSNNYCNNKYVNALRPLPLGSFLPDDDILGRGRRLLARLQIGKFQPHTLWNLGGTTSWPGDFEGRTLLALTLLERATGHKAEVLDEHWEQWPLKLNSRGYFGPINDSLANEQQLASHGWVLRALCEGIIANPSRSDQFKEFIIKIIDELILPSYESQKIYPITNRRGSGEGAQSGTPTKQLGNWILSTDIGCNWILIDGLTQALDFTPNERLSQLIDVMIDRFLSTNLIDVGAQTHATLSGLRGCLRRSHQTGNTSLINEVIDRYRLFLSNGMTINWANHNWFGHPKWTEPCAMVDAFQLALGLWHATRDPSYMNDAHRFLYTALGHAQRANGGFGTDTCCGSSPNIGGSGDLLCMNTYEAHWCCSMRGGEGISRAIESTWWSNGEDILLCLPHSGTLRLPDGMHLRIDTQWPHDGILRIEVLSAPPLCRRKLRIFIPDGCAIKSKVDDDGFASFDQHWAVGNVLIIDLGLSFSFNEIDRGRTIWRGPLMFGGAPDAVLPADPKMTQEAPFVWSCNNNLITPLNDVFNRMELSPEIGNAWQRFQRRVIFR